MRSLPQSAILETRYCCRLVTPAFPSLDSAMGNLPIRPCAEWSYQEVGGEQQAGGLPPFEPLSPTIDVMQQQMASMRPDCDYGEGGDTWGGAWGGG